jgi:3-hydroxy-9,10-secoandrosta-1,3,5(10)-triene-9,17-dione monooxygenase
VNPTITQELPIPEPNLTADDLLERAKSLLPLLREEQEATEERAAPSFEIHEQMRKLGLYRIVQPRRFGGYEFSLEDMCRVSIQIARGCPSTGWYYSFTANHTQIVAQLFGEEGQSKAFGPDGDFLAPVRAPVGNVARKVDGGWLLDGRWDYCSGAPYATHFVPMVLIAPEDDPDGDTTDQGVAIVPREQWTMLEDWGDNIIGMRGTGSNTIVIESQFIPDCSFARGSATNIDLSKPTPGYELHGNPMYSGRLISVLHSESAAFAVGTARAALDDYEEFVMPKRAIVAPFGPRIEHHNYQRAFGLALGMVDTAELALYGACQRHLHHSTRAVTEGPAGFTAEQDLRLMAVLQHVSQTCIDAVDLLWRTGGTSVAKSDSRMQRYYRDLAVLRTHVGHQYETFAESLSRAHFGIDTEARDVNVAKRD